MGSIICRPKPGLNGNYGARLRTNPLISSHITDPQEKFKEVKKSSLKLLVNKFCTSRSPPFTHRRLLSPGGLEHEAGSRGRPGVATGRSSGGRPRRSRLRRGVTQRPRSDRRTARPGTGHRAGTAPPRARETARKAASARGGRRGARRPRLGGVGAAGRGVSASGRRRRAQQSRPNAATHCPAPARHRRDGRSAARRAARPRGQAGGARSRRTSRPRPQPHLRERSTPSAASWPAAPGPRAPGDRAPVAAVVADPVGSGEPGEAAAALAAEAPSSRGAHAAVPTRRPERDIRYIVGIPRASRDPSSRVTPGRIPARAGRPRPCSPAPAPPRRPLPAPPGRAATCPAVEVRGPGAPVLPSASYQSVKKKRNSTNQPARLAFTLRPLL
ncbi:translation initiation factor IF-2-like [Mesocricetus auratus]|uniref:Translation initiation factor IF-2-like n=1 Tax=Mesocricetus auratus TaxID=10036 RepID=A0ABM2X6I2_MESAU|nr:translation initiation factor IF-2-like [Mesocricetus auratus]